MIEPLFFAFQINPGILDALINPFKAVTSSAIGAFLSTVLIGGLVVTFARKYAERVIN